MPITEQQLLPQDEWRAVGGWRSGLRGGALILYQFLYQSMRILANHGD